jgi:hypothetical protein
MTVVTDDANAKKVLALMDAGLITPAEVGKGFVKQPFTPRDPSDHAAKMPCGQPSTAALFPNALRTGTDLVQGQNAEFEESVTLYLDAATAGQAFEADVAGVTCDKGDISGTPVTISKPQDVTAEIGGSKAVAWSIEAGGSRGVLVAVNSGSVTIGFTFLAAPNADTSKLPNTLDVAKKATAKLLATGVH